MGVRARQATPPGPASSRIRSLRACGHWRMGRAGLSLPLFPSPFPLRSPAPSRAHPHSSPGRHTLPRALAARVFPPWPRDRQRLRVTAAVQPDTCRPAAESMQAPAGGSGDESLRPESVLPTFVPSRPFCRPQSPSLTVAPAPRPASSPQSWSALYGCPDRVGGGVRRPGFHPRPACLLALCPNSWGAE